MTEPALDPAGRRPKKSTGIVVLLVIVSLANLFALVVGVAGVVDEADHGAEWDDASLRAMTFVVVMSLIALVGLVGAWLTRQWGPRVYVISSVLSLIIGLLLSEGSFNPFSLVGLALAVGLWLHAENNW